jgi:myosin heavy subunit
MKVGFNKHFKIQGCEIINYLLEKSRVVTQSANERNYHIFYQLICGADSAMKQRLFLRAISDYKYLSLSGCVKIEGVDDTAEFSDVMESMRTLQFPAETIEMIWKIISGVLMLGNLSFETATPSDHSIVASSSADTVRICSELFGLNPELFTYSLTEKKVQMGRGSIVGIKLSQREAEDSRDTLAKTLYSNLFDWIIGK